MAFQIPDEEPANDEPDLKGWDRETMGLMVEYEVETGFKCEPYDPDKDPVNKGLVPDPYASGEDS